MCAILCPNSPILKSLLIYPQALIMALAQEDLEQIQWLIKKSLAETP
ncbi:MAG: hypothetical protein QX195_10190 [Methylococcaceae bacterium]